METSLSFFLIKNAFFFCYLVSYHITIVGLMLFMLFMQINYLKYVSELSFYSNCSLSHFFLIVTFITFAGLPPLFFFFAKITLLVFVILQEFWFIAALLLLLIFLGWFIYLNVAKVVSYQSWSFSSVIILQDRNLNTNLSFFLVFLLYVFLFSFFFLSDIVLFFCCFFI